MNQEASQLTTPRKKANCRTVSICLPGNLWPALLAASTSPSSLSRLGYLVRKIVCVLLVADSLRQGGTLAAGARRAGVRHATATRWLRAFERCGVGGLLPRTHLAGRRRMHVQPRGDRAISLPVGIALQDLTVRGGHVAFRASARPVLSAALRRANRRALSNLVVSLPVAFRPIFKPSEARHAA